MSHPNEIVTAAVAPENDWRTAYPFVEKVAKAILDTWPADAPRLSTQGLVERIYSPDGPIDPNVLSRIYRALNACALHGLRDYVVLGAPGRVGSVLNARRKLWGRPVKPGTYCCPTCGRPL